MPRYNTGRQQWINFNHPVPHPSQIIPYSPYQPSLMVPGTQPPGRTQLNQTVLPHAGLQSMSMGQMPGPQIGGVANPYEPVLQSMSQGYAQPTTMMQGAALPTSMAQGSALPPNLPVGRTGSIGVPGAVGLQMPAQPPPINPVLPLGPPKKKPGSPPMTAY